MDDSILTSVKKLLGIDKEYTHFDHDIIIHINSTFMILGQLGIKQAIGFVITGKEETWDELMPDGSTLSAVKSYIPLKVRLLFDPPTSSAVKEAIQNMINELEWRLNVAVDPGEEENSK